MESPLAKLVLTCTGSIADEDLKDRLDRIKTTLQYLSQSDCNSVNLSKLEPWNSVRVTFNIPPEAAARLRELAQRGDPNLHKLGILTVQVENGEAISLPPPPVENQHSLFSPPPPAPSEMPQLPPGPPLVPPSPVPVVSPPVIPASTPTPGLVIPGHGPGGQGTGSSFPVPGVSLQQPTRPSLQGLQSQGPTVAPPFAQQGPGNLWNPMGISQQRPLQPPSASFWNQIPQFFPQVNMSQANNQQQGMVSGPPMPPAPQPKPQPKKRRKRTKKANIQPPDLAVAAGQPLLPLPPHLQTLPPSNTNAQDASDNLNTNKPSNLSLPPSLIDNPISPNTPPTTALSTSAAIAAPIMASSSNAGTTQFSFTDIPISRGLVPSPHTQQQLLQKKTDVTLTSPLLVNLLQSDISAKQFPFTNTTGSKTMSTGTETLTPGMSGPGSQDIVQTSTLLGNTSSPFMLGNGLGTAVHPSSAIANMHPFATSQGSTLGHPSVSNQFLPSNALLQAQSGQLSQEQLQFHLNQLSGVQHSPAPGPHGQSFSGSMPQGASMPSQNPMQPGPKQMQLHVGHMQPFPLPGGQHVQGPTFTGLMPHSQLPDARMSIGPVTLHDQVPQGQITLGRPMLMGQVPSQQPSHPPLNGTLLSQSKEKSQPTKQSPPVSSGTTSGSSIPSADPTNKPHTPIVDKPITCMDSRSKDSTKPSITDTASNQQKTSSEKSGDGEKYEVQKQPQESHVFDEETALLGMTEAERDTMAVAAIIAKEAKMAADAKNDKQAQNKDASTTSTESQHTLQTAQPFTTVSCSGGDTVCSLASTSTLSTLSTGTFSGSQPNQPSKAGPPVPERRPSNSPIRLSPPQMPESIRQRRTPPSAPKQIQHQPPHYGPIPGDPPSSMASGIAGLQTLTSRTFSAAAQPSIRDMALSRNPENTTLSQFLRSVTPPSEILQMAPLFRSSKQQEIQPKVTAGFQPGPTCATSEWLSLPNVDTQKPLLLPAHVGARTSVQPAEFSAATERMLGSMLDIQKPGLVNIERPPNQPRVITTEGINFMHKLVGRTSAEPLDQGPSKESKTKADQQEQTIPTEQVKKEDKSQLKALLNEIVTSEKCPFEKHLSTDDSKPEKAHPVTGSLDSVSLERQLSTVSSVSPHQIEQWFELPKISIAQATAKNTDSLAQSGNISSIYIPPTCQQQQQSTLNQPLSSAQQATTTSIHTSAAPLLDDTHCRNPLIKKGTEGAGRHQLDQMEPLKHFPLASSSVNPSQPVSVLQRVLGTEVADDTTSRHPQDIHPSHSRGLEVELPGAKLSLSSHQQCTAFTKRLPSTSSSITLQNLSLQETPMTVLERVPPILLPSATFSRASQEQIKSLGAHGIIAGLIPGSDLSPPAPLQTQNFAAKIPDQPYAENDAPETPSVKPGVASLMGDIQPRVAKRNVSSSPTIDLQGEQQLQQVRNESQDVQGADRLKAPCASIVPAPTSETASVSHATMLPPAPAKISGEYSSKIPPSELLATSNVPHQSSEIQPEKLSERPPPFQKSVMGNEGRPVSHELQALGEGSQSTDLCVNRPGSVQSQEATLLPEISARTSSENTKQFEVGPKTSVPQEIEKTQQVYKKIGMDRHVAQQQQPRTSASLAAFGFAPVPPSTNTSPVKPSAYPSASSTLAQAQSIMVKTGAMSRTSGIIKGTEQASRPVRSRTPPRASLSTLPPNTCNNESLGSASALLSSIAKSAWTVTTAMASAAKAKVVPTPKASDKNPPRMRRSPETLPLTGRTAGDRDKSNPTTDASNQQTRTVPGPQPARETFKTLTTELVTNITQPEVKDFGSCPRGNFQSIPFYLAVTESKELKKSTAVPTFHTAVTAPGEEMPQVSLPVNLPTIKLETGCRDAHAGSNTQTSSSQELPVPSNPVTSSFTGPFQSMGTLSCSRSQQSDNQTSGSAGIHSDVHQPRPSVSHELKSPEANSRPQIPEEFLKSGIKTPGCDLSAKALPKELQASSATITSKVPSDLTSLPMKKSFPFPQNPYNLPQGDLSEKHPVTQKNEELYKLHSKSSDQPSSVVITTPVAPFVPGHSQTAHVPSDALPTDPSTKKTASLQPSLLEPLKRAVFLEEVKSPSKQMKSNLEHLLQQSFEVGTRKEPQAQQQLGENKKEPSKVSSDLPSPDVSASKTGAPTTQTVHQLVKKFTLKTTETANQDDQFKDEQAQQLHIQTKQATSEFSAFESVQLQRVDIVSRTERRTILAPEGSCESAAQPGPVLSLEETVSLKPNTPPESVFLNKPDQITNLVEEVIQSEPDKDILFEKSLSTLPVQSSQSSEPSISKASEPEHGEIKTEEMPVKSLDAKEQSKEGVARMGKDAEGEFEPRRTRHSSEEVPGMSTRSLRSGRRSPGEPITRTKEKEESPPATRGRGQKKEETGSEMDPEALSRKRSTRSSGRDMYYGPIISYKRRKTNQK